MKKALYALLIMLILIGLTIIFYNHTTKPHADTHTPPAKVVKTYPKTISIAMAQYDATEFEEQFLNDFWTRETKILAIPEGDGYGFLSGSATVEDADGNIIAEYNAETDPNAATIGEILDAIEESKQ
jgi:hypothetical protein